MFLAFAVGKIVESTHIEAVADIEVVKAVIVVKLADRAGIVRRGTRFIGSGCVTERFGIGVLRVQRQACAQSATQTYLQRVVVIASTTGLVIDFGERILDRRSTRHDGEFTNRLVHCDYLTSGVGSIDDTNTRRQRRAVQNC